MATVTLTFDNGPTPGVSERVLDVLAARGLCATFFVVGDRLARPGARALAERAVAEGHWLGNHSATHRVALGSLDDPAAIDAEIDDCEALLDGLRHPDRLFRPFGNGGAIDDRMLGPHAVARLVDGGFTCVLWTSVPHDWDDPAGWVSRALPVEPAGCRPRRTWRAAAAPRARRARARSHQAWVRCRT